MLGEWLAHEITRTFLTSQFDGGRHARRVDKITALEWERRPTIPKGRQRKPARQG